MPRTKENKTNERKELLFFKLDDFKVKHARYVREYDCFFFSLLIPGCYFNNLCFRYNEDDEKYFLCFPSQRYEKDDKTKYSPYFKIYLSDEDTKRIFRMVDEMTK